MFSFSSFTALYCTFMALGEENVKQNGNSVFWSLLAVFTEKAMAPYSSALAWKIPGTEEPGGLQSMGSGRVGND